MAETVEELSYSLVREFLSRKGLKNTLASFEVEKPENLESLKNRVELAKSIKIDKLMKKNKENPLPYRTMVEVIVDSLINSPSDDRFQPGQRPMTGFSRSMAGPHDQSSLLMDRRNAPNLRLSVKQKPVFKGPAAVLHQTPYSKELDTFDNISSPIKPPQSSSHSADSVKNNERFFTRLGNTEGDAKYRLRFEGASKVNTEKSRFSKGQTRPPTGQGILSQRIESDKKDFKNVTSTNPKSITSSITSSKRTNSLDSEEAVLCEDLEDGDIKVYGVNAAQQESTQEVASTSLPSGRPITSEQVKDLRRILFGEKGIKTFNMEWKKQNLIFSNVPHLEYGLVQHKGGPCGVLASLQAHILKHLMFEDPKKPDLKESPRPSSYQRNKALVSSMAEIIWRAGDGKTATIAMPSSAHGNKTPNSSDIIDKLILYLFEEKTNMLLFLENNITLFEQESSSGCILFTLSVVLTRGISRVRLDMDEPTSQLIGAHCYCTQELVNLILTGAAVSNVFDGVVNLDSGGDNNSILKGIDSTWEIGFLSLFEHYGSCKVGDHYKNPTYPIFVVCSESHFIVLFATVRKLMQIKKLQSCFDLYYYDGLANQTEPICLTISTDHSGSGNTDDLVPPIELCIRTRWENSSIDWNGSEKLL